MESHNSIKALTDALSGLVPAVEKLISVDIDAAVMSSLSKKDQEEVEAFKKTSEVLKKAENMAKDFNSKSWNV